MVIKALGFDPEDLPKLFNEEKLQVSRWGKINECFVKTFISCKRRESD